MRALLEQARRVAPYPTTVLIEGETGTGKEVLADYLHHHSPRRNLPFIKVNCASIPEALFESELFGYERGAFTGAKREGHPGLFELANEGTLLLDEVGELSPSIQAKLLRVLQDREVRRVGGSWSKAVDVRVVACTNRRLEELVVQGRFREDLYYRLKVVHLRVPPLRERPEDIIPLCRMFLDQFCDAFGMVRRLTPDAEQALLAYPWPGNVRELRNAMEAICATTERELIDLEDLSLVLRFELGKQVRFGNGAERLPAGPTQAVGTPVVPYAEAMAAAERQILAAALAQAPSVRAAAAALQLSHSTLLRKMARHGLEAPRSSRRC
jgi:two-component system response regulator AtoC